MSGKTALKVAIDAEIYPHSGGISSVAIGLVSSLGKLTDSDDEYLIICPAEDPDWLKKYLGPNQSTRVRSSPGERGSGETFKKMLGPLRPTVRNVYRKIFPVQQNADTSTDQVPISDGFYESLGCDVLHIPFQNFVMTSLPTIYNPHDLQHLHYPEFFDSSEIARRNSLFPAGCRYANTVVTGSEWVKQDLLNHYALNARKIQVIPWAPPTQAYQKPDQDFLNQVRQKYLLPEKFAFYPAFTWPHKNHLRLLDATALIRNREGLKVNFVFVGGKTSFAPKIEHHILVQNLQEQVWHLGEVSNDVLRALYALTDFVVIPTLFEASSLPLYEAWQDAVPVACSNVTSLPEQAADAALIFDPLSVDSIASAITRMSTEPDLRQRLILRGQERLKDFSWDRTARAYRAVYRRAVGAHLSEEDKHLLNWDWMKKN
jgi:glycosyltransferase involved in cell wall biosynthesis